MCLPNADGTADLVACNLPAERAVACMRTLDTEAHSAKRAGDPRSIDQLRTDIFLDRLDGDRSTHEASRVGWSTSTSISPPWPGSTPTRGRSPGSGRSSPTSPARWPPASMTRSGGSPSPTRRAGLVAWNGTTRRRPTVTQRRYLEARNRTCVFPGCRMPAMDSDIDHTKDFAKGGRTDPSNLGPLCRHHHRLKHEGEWKLEQPEPGVFRWTSRLGHVYTVGPGPP